ncbi:MAG: TolC family protein [Spongiibacteraceae bacterium]
MVSFFARGAIVCLCILVPAANGTYAAEFMEPRGELTLSAAINAALQRNPALQNAAFEIRVADARIKQAGLRPNPELGITLENFGGNGSVSGTDALESTLSLSQVIELGGKRNRRLDVAHFGRDTVSIERESAQLDVLAEVARRFIDVAEQQEQLLLARRNTELADKTVRAINTRVEAARSPLAEKSRASIAFNRARLDEKTALQNLLSSRRRLAALWGSTDPRFGDAKTEWFELPPVAEFDTLVSQMKSNPDFLRFASEARMRDAEWQLAKAEAKSNVTVGAGIRRFEETGDKAFVVNFSMPLAFGSRNQGAIREASIRREQLQNDEQAALINAQANLFAFYQSLELARNEVDQLRNQIIPQAETALKQTQDGYERGRFSYLELADAQRELLELQRAAIAAAASYHRTLAEIERLTNSPLIATKD